MSASTNSSQAIMRWMYSCTSTVGVDQHGALNPDAVQMQVANGSFVGKLDFREVDNGARAMVGLYQQRFKLR